MDEMLIWALMPQKQLWHLLPLVVVVSLVYGATRHEGWPDILDHALRFGVWILGFLSVIFAILLAVSWSL